MTSLLKLRSNMPAIQDFKNAPDKAAFILSAQFDRNFYAVMNKAEHFSMDERKSIAKELVDNSYKYEYDLLLIKLIDLCFLNKGSEFIRGGSADFLGDILQEFARQNEGDKFVAACKKVLQENPGTKSCAFPEEFQMGSTLAFILSYIVRIANKFDQDKTDTTYTSNLGQNLANKIFFPLLINAGTPQEGAALVTPFKVWAATKQVDVGTYMLSHASLKVGDIVDQYYKQKTVQHENAISSIKNLIKEQSWVLGGFGFFQGGLTIELDGVEHRVPHRVAAMAQLIKDYEDKPDSKDVFELYDRIRDKAQEALDMPRAGQHESTRVFYNDVLKNLYVSDTVDNGLEVDNEQQKLI